jgi:hypothetical protein
MRVEKEIFTSLFRLAMEDVDMFPEMRNCMDRMPWGELHGIGNGPDSTWFKSEIRDGDGSHSLGIAASQAPEIQPLVRPSISFPHLALPSSSRQHQTSLDSRRIQHSSEPEDVTIQERARARVSPDPMDIEDVAVQGRSGARISPDPMDVEDVAVPERARVLPDAMDIDEENRHANPQRSGNYSRMTGRTRKEIARANVTLPQIHKLRLKVSERKPLLKGRKRAMVEDGKGREGEGDDSDDSEEDDSDEEEEEEETVCGQTQTSS